jgi:hypothetical protein
MRFEQFAGFDEITEFPQVKPKVHKYLAELGKTRSAGELFKGKTERKMVRNTMQQLNLLKLPRYIWKKNLTCFSF